MEELSREELISAYLDGELSAQEQARVEQLLATDPDARALLEELRALSDTLQALPRLKLDEDLSGRVLRRAERAMLAPQETLAAAAAAPRKPELQLAAATNGEAHDSAARKAGHGVPSRGVAWSALAVAAALLIMIAYPGGERNVVQHEGRAPQANAPAEKHATGVSDEAAPEHQLAQGDKSLPPEGEPAGGRETPVLAAQRGAAPADDAAASRAEATSDDADRDAQLANREAVAKERLAASAAPRPDTVAGAAAKADHDELRQAARPAAEIADAIARKATAGLPAAPNSRAAMERETAGLRGGHAGDVTGALAVETLIVNVTVSPAAAESGEFETLLAQHDIQWADDSFSVPLGGPLGAQGEPAALADEADGNLQSKNALADDSRMKKSKGKEAKRALADAERGGAAPKGNDAAKDEQAKGDALANGARAGAADDVELVYLVAPQDQVDATLAELRQRHKDFQVSVAESTDLKRTLDRLELQQLQTLLGIEQEQAPGLGFAQAEALSRYKKETGGKQQLADARPAESSLAESKLAEDQPAAEDAAGEAPASDTLSEKARPAPREERRSDTKGSDTNRRDSDASNADKRMADKKSFAAGKGQAAGQAAELQAKRATAQAEQKRSGQPRYRANQAPGTTIDGVAAPAPRGVARRLRMTDDREALETWRMPGVAAPAMASRANTPKPGEAAEAPAAAEAAARNAPAPEAAKIAPQAKASNIPPAAPLRDSEAQLATRGTNALGKQLAAAGSVRVLFVLRVDNAAAAAAATEAEVEAPAAAKE